jgi:hypothetical protein
MSLREKILAYVSAARSSPVVASDPTELRGLEKAALSTLDCGFATLAAPIAPFTWEVRTLLDATLDATNRVKFAFPWRVNVVGLQATLSIVLPRTAPGGVPQPDPTLADIDCMVDVNNSAFLTGNDGLSTVAGQGGQNFVTLSTLSIQTPRLLGLALEGESKPELGFTFRWKQPPAAGPVAIYQSAIVCVALFCYPQAERGLSNQTSFGRLGT